MRKINRLMAVTDFHFECIACDKAKANPPLIANGERVVIQRYNTEDAKPLSIVVFGRARRDPSEFQKRAFGGEGGIRTLDEFYPIHTFQACSFSRSDTSPIEHAGENWRRPESHTPDTHPLLPLLPSGPDGVHSLSLRGDPGSPSGRES